MRWRAIAEAYACGAGCLPMLASLIATSAAKLQVLRGMRRFHSDSRVHSIFNQVTRADAKGPVGNAFTSFERRAHYSRERRERQDRCVSS